MTTTPRERRYRRREQQILDHARRIAENEGWPAVTTRRLAQEIDHSQPVIYQHFRNREHLIAAIVAQGFVELTALTRQTVAETSDQTLEGLCWVYLNFAKQHPALYEAMFTRPSQLQFAQVETPGELSEAFFALSEVIAREAEASEPDELTALTEFFWAACHGIASLHLAGRIPESHLHDQVQRICVMTCR